MLLPVRDEVRVFSLENPVRFATNSCPLEHPTYLVPLRVLFRDLDSFMGLESRVTHLQDHIEYVVIVPVDFVTDACEILKNELQVLVDVGIYSFVHFGVGVVGPLLPC